MAASAPAAVPSTAPAAVQAQQQQQSQPQGQLQRLSQRGRDVFSSVLKEKRPWSEVLDRSAFSRPPDLQTATQRLRKNAAYFKLNYSLVLLTIVVISVALNPSALLALAGCACAWVYFMIVRQAPLVIAGRTFSEREKLVGLTIVTVVVTFFLTSVGTVLFTALGISAVLIALHGAFREPDDLFSDEPDGQAPGLLSFFQTPPPAGINAV